MTTFGWKLGDVQRRGERRLTEDRRTGNDRRALVKPFSWTSMPSVRQLEVLAFAADGLTQFEIARKLDMSPNTVSSHLGAAIKRVGAKNTINAVTICIVRGWLIPNR